MRRLASLLVASLLPACGAITTGQYRGLSVGPLGCPEDEITVSEHKNVVWAGQSMTWRASCRGRIFLCSMAGTTATCSPELAPSATPPPPSKAPVGGCEYDTQCKGDRICVDRTCVDPPSASPEVSVDAEPAGPR